MILMTTGNPYDAEQHDVGDDVRHRLDLRLRQAAEVPYRCTYYADQTTQIGQYDLVEQIDALHHRDPNQPDQRREKGGQHNRNEDVGRVRRPQLGAIDHDADGDQRQPRRIEDEEHDLGVRGRVFLGVQLLQLLHGFEPQRRRRVVEPQHVGGEVHDHRTMNRMVARDLRKQPVEERPHHLRQGFDHAALLPNTHQSQPQRQDAGQAQRDLEPHLGHLERAVHHGREDLGIVQKDQPEQPDDQGDQKEGDPDVVENHSISPCRWPVGLSAAVLERALTGPYE
jgi:hypothetical protein